MARLSLQQGAAIFVLLSNCLFYFFWILRVQVHPVAGNVDGHAQLEEKHVLGVEETERHHQAHGATPVGQLVQHCTKFGTWWKIRISKMIVTWRY